MADIATITQRAVIATQALATMGVDPEWDRKLAAYLRADALQFADSEFGAFYKASEEYSWRKISLKNGFEPAAKGSEESKVVAAEIVAAHKIAEELWYENYTKSFWEAGRELVKTPAPTLAAALFKVHVAYAEEVWNDIDMDGDVMAIVSADMARLAG